MSVLVQKGNIPVHNTLPDRFTQKGKYDQWKVDWTGVNLSVTSYQQETHKKR